MIVCVCNAIKDREISQAVSEGCGSVSKIFKNLGCAPCCGKCVPFVRENFLAGEKPNA